MRIAYLYFMAPNPERVRPVVPRHVAYWHELRLAGYEGGPFADRSGGLIIFEADAIATATAIASADPFALEGLLADAWVKEWRAETSSPVRRP